MSLFPDMLDVVVHQERYQECSDSELPVSVQTRVAGGRWL